MKKKFLLTLITTFCLSSILTSIAFAKVKSITVGGQSFTVYNNDEDISGMKKVPSGVSGLSGNWYTDEYDDIKAALDSEKNNSTNGWDVDVPFNDIVGKSNEDLGEMGKIMGDYKPSFEQGAAFLVFFQNPIRAFLGLFYVIGILLFIAIEAYNFFIIFNDGAFDQMGAGATDTSSGAPNSAVGFLNKWITKNTKKCINLEEGRISTWIKGEAGKLFALALMIILLVNGAIFKLIIFAANLIGSFFGG